MSAHPKKKLNERHVREALRAARAARTDEPPADLAERIKGEVPSHLELAPDLAAEGGSSPPSAGRRRWLAAAAVVLVTLGAGVIGVRVLEQTEQPVAVQDGDAEPVVPERAETPTEEPDRVAIPDAVAPPPIGPPQRSAEGDRRTSAGKSEAGTAERAGAAQPEASNELREQMRARAGEMELRSENRAVQSPAPPARRQDRTEAEPSQEVVVVTSESPLLDERKVSAGTTVSRKEAERSPTARDPWQVATETPGVLSDRITVGGDAEGQQPVFTAPAAVAPSTGGTAEPNDRPYGDVFFRGYGTNPFLDTEDDPLSTFGLDVDTGSWGVVRRYLRDGNLPPREAVRVEELVNAFDYGDPPPAEGDFRIVAEGARTPFAGRSAEPRYRLLRFGLHAREVAAADRPPAVLTFVVDVSGSMAREDRLGLVRRALLLLLDQLREDDRVGLVVYGSRGRVLLEPTGDLEAIRSAVDRLRPGGSTNAEEGLALAYDVARRAAREGAINRLILCSDGVANVGHTGPESILERIGEEARRGVELTTVGFGMGNYNDALMEQLADRGDGAYAYVDDLGEARRIFVENLTGTLQTIARDAKVQVEFDPEVVARYRLLGYENRDVPDERFRDDTVDAGEIGAGHAVTALYEVKLRQGVDPEEGSERTAATLRLRWESAASGRVEEVSRRVTVGELAGRWRDAPQSLRLASVVAELAEALKGTYWARGTDLEELFRRAQEVAAEFPGDLEVSELATLVGRAARLSDD